MPQQSLETLQAQLAVYDEHLAQTEELFAALKKQLAQSRVQSQQALEALLANHYHAYHLLKSTPPATCAAEDQLRERFVCKRPLSVTEQMVKRARGNVLTRSMTLLIGLLIPIIPLLIVRRVRELRQQAFREWMYLVQTKEREILHLEQEIRSLKDTEEQRAMRSRLAGVDRTLQQLQLNRDLLRVRIQEYEQPATFC